MTKLDSLIAELCPDGVEYRTLGEIATEMYRGSGIKREQITENGIPCVRYGEIYTTYNIWFDKCVSHTNENEIVSRKYFEHGDVLFAITGESVEEIAKSCVYVGYEKCLAGGDIVVMKHNQEPKYMAYVLSTEAAQEQKSKGRIKSKVVHSNVPALKAITVPVPPLPVQREIVRILDNFTELTAYYCDSHNHDGEAIVMSRSGAYAGFVSFWKQPIFVTDGFIFETRDGLQMKYLYYILKNKQESLHQMKRGGGVPHVRGNEIMELIIPVPSLEEQSRIVAILDRFDTLTTNISAGLPAEIAARQKQYEYYRDKLLTFPAKQTTMS